MILLSIKDTCILNMPEVLISKHKKKVLSWSSRVKSMQDQAC